MALRSEVHQGLGFKLARVLGVLTIVVGALFAFPGGAWAASPLTGPPDADGHYMHCNISTDSTTWGASPATHRWSASCQYGPTTTTVNVNGFTIGWKNTSAASFNTQPCGAPATTTNAGGQFVCSNATYTGSTGSPVDLSQVTCSGSLTNGQTVSTSQCGVKSAVAGSAPSVPPDYWPGGTAGPENACFTVSPSGVDVGATATLDGSCSVNASSYTWTISGGVGPTTGQTVTHTWAVAGRYSVKLRINGSSGVDSVTAFVDVGGGGTGEGGGDVSSAGSDCGSWWHLFCHIVGAVKTALIPDTADLQSSWNGLSQTAASHYPLGPILWGGTTVRDLLGSFGSSATASSGGCTAGGEGEGPDLQFSRGVGVPPIQVHVPVIPNCPDSQTAGGVVAVRSVVYAGSSVLMIVGFVFFVLRLVGIRVGRGGSEGEDG